MNICTKCKRKAEYDSPNSYCLRHWCEWWNQAFNYTPKELTRQIKLSMRRIRYKERKDKNLAACSDKK